MKKILLSNSLFIFIIVFNSCLTIPENTGQNNSVNNNTNDFEIGIFSIPENAELLEKTEFKSNGIPYIIEQRYRLPSGQIMYAYYDVEGTNSITIQKLENAPLLGMGTDVNIPGLPGYREFNFGDDNRKLVQFMKIFRLGKKDYRGNINTPSLSDYTFKASTYNRSEFVLLLDLYDESWVLEHREWDGRRLSNTNTTAIFHTNRFRD